MSEQATAEAPKSAPAADTKAAPTATPQATTAKPAEAEATREITVNGQKIKVTDAQLVTLAQKGHFADQKLKSMDVLQKNTAGLINALKTTDGFLSVLNDKSLGVSPKEVFRKLMSSDVIDDELKDEMSKWVYDNVVVQGKKSPEQIETEKKLTDYERLKKAEESRKNQEAEAGRKSQEDQIYDAIRVEVGKQVKADKTFPLTEGVTRDIISKLRVMNRQGAPVTVETITKALELVKKDHLLHQQEMFDKIEDTESLISYFGEARALRISKALVARLQAKAKAKAKEDAPVEGTVRERVTDRIDKKLGRTPHGYSILDV